MTRTKQQLIAEYGEPLNYRLRTHQQIGGAKQQCHILQYHNHILFVFEDKVIRKDAWEPDSKWFYPITSR